MMDNEQHPARFKLVQDVSSTQPPQRQWIPLARPEAGRPAAIFTVMCYNVLCDKYCTRQQYGYCPSWGLNWEYRKKGIMDEIRTCAADIIGLQEVETDQFYNFFKPELERDGYQGIFSPKSRARTMTEQERKHVDGCAIFFRTSKFTLLKEHLIEFNQLAMANAEGGLPPEGKINQRLLITTAHMHWDPEFSDVKLIQTMMLMSELKKVVEESNASIQSTEQGDCNSIPIILCGDLNSLPESGKVPSNHIDFKELGYEASLQAFNCHDTSTHLTHMFRLAKAYEDNIMKYTNYTFEFKGIIDYIFYSRKYMNLLGVLGPMDENWFIENKVVGCPHPHIPSDHFSLFVEFEMPVPYPDINTILKEDSHKPSSLGAIGSGVHRENKNR
ncbi:CNOT6-like protein [Mya arenaria]|uniref:CNOT6-like protein n=1 Tax=Mya arenaria TaxID=6604 RepID=A0ABY7DFS6_MYAAR|nr:CNOT6-like protein [Mya arenaria]